MEFDVGVVIVWVWYMYEGFLLLVVGYSVGGYVIGLFGVMMYLCVVVFVVVYVGSMWLIV